MSTSSKTTSIARRLLDWFRHAARPLPWRNTADPYAIWVSEIMLQQTQVKTVMPYWERWMKALPTLQHLARIDSGTLHKLWEGLGYYSRARNMHRAAQLVQERHQGRFPQAHDEILALPGIGPYTAGAICSIAFNQPTPILDGNVIRVLCRLFAVEGDPASSQVRQHLWALAGELVKAAGGVRPAPRGGRSRELLAHRAAWGDAACSKKLGGFRAASPGGRKTLPTPDPITLQRSSPAGAAPRRVYSDLNQALMELGALICLPKTPRCEACPVRALCRAHATGQVERFPKPRVRAPITRRRFVAFVLKRGPRYLVRQRPAGTVNAHLWEFPNIETDEADPSLAAARAGVRAVHLVKLVTVSHSITRYRIRMEVFAGAFRAGNAGVGNWHTLRELAGLAFSSAHKRVLEAAVGTLAGGARPARRRPGRRSAQWQGRANNGLMRVKS